MKGFRKVLIAFVLIVVCLFNNYFVYANASKVKIPPAPNSLTFSNVTSTEATISWKNTPTSSGYHVYRSTNNLDYSLIATVSTTSYRDNELTPSTKYWYYVSAYNPAGVSPDSTKITFTTASEPVTSPVPSISPEPTATPQPSSSPEPTATPQPSISPEPTPAPVVSKTVLGYATYYFNGDASSYNSMVANTSSIDEIATHTYITNGSGAISGLIPNNQITYANSNNIKTYAMVSNNFDGAIAKTLLESATNRQNLINNLLKELKLYGYKGVNVDLEGVYPSNRPQLTTFMSELYPIMKAQGYEVAMSVPAKVSDSPTNSWNGAFDIPALANYVDSMVIMTYDEHYPGGSPGPIASIGWVENVIKYFNTVVPKDKIILGVPAYGYDWSSLGTKAFGIRGAYNLAASMNATINWDNKSKSPFFNYVDSQGISHSVWFENAESLSYKLDLVNSYGISGIAIWRLGLEDADYWNVINNKLNK